MKDSKMIKVFKSLSKEEVKYLGWFVKSNFFNTDGNIARLYDILKKYYPGFASNKLEKEKVYKKLFPNVEYSDGKMRNLMSKMYQVLEDYIVVLELKENQLKKNMLLTEVFKKRGLLNELRTTINSIIKRLNESPYRDEEYYYSIKNLYHDSYFYSGKLNRKEMQKSLENAKNNLDIYYHLAKLKIDGEFEARSALYESHPRKSVENKLNESLIPNVIYQIMKNILDLYKTRQYNTYLKTKNLYFENYKLIRKIEQKFILKHLVSHAIRQLPNKEERYSKEVFKLYNFAHENDLLTTNGKITNTSFLNIISITARAKEFEWIEQFILDNEKKLESKTKEEIKTLGLANLAFYKKNYSDVLKLMATLKYNDVNYEIVAKILSLKAYFELFISDESYFDLILSYSNSFEKFMKRISQLIGRNKSVNIINFIKHTRKLAALSYKNNYKSNDWKKLKQEIEYSSIIERNWLISKVKEKSMGKH